MAAWNEMLVSKPGLTVGAEDSIRGWLKGAEDSIKGWLKGAEDSIRGWLEVESIWSG